MNFINIDLGALERSEDKRDINLDKLKIYGGVSTPVLDVYLPDYSWLQRNYQGQTPSCGPHAASHAKAILEHIENLNQIQRYSPRYLWIKDKNLIDKTPLENGTDMRSLLQSLQSYGICDFELLGNDITLPLDTYSSLSAITPTIDDNARTKIISKYGFSWNIDFQSIKSLIKQNAIVILLIKVDDGFWGTNNPTFTNALYGHFVIANGYDETSIRVLDSADPNDQYAVKFIDQKYITPPFVLEIGTIVDMPNWQAAILTDPNPLVRKMAYSIINLINSFKSNS